MDDPQRIRSAFQFLLDDRLFQAVKEQAGDGSAEALFCSPLIHLRISGQRELLPTGLEFQYIAFLVDPQNARRWCVFEAAVKAIAGQLPAPCNGLEDLAALVRAHISPILQVLQATPEKIPLQDFSKL